MKDSGLSLQRFSEFSQKSRNITGEYFLKMLSGVGLSHEEMETLSNMPFSKEQSVQLEFDSFVKGQKSFLEELMKDPAKLQICKTAISFKGIWNNPHVKKLFLKLSELKRSRHSPFN